MITQEQALKGTEFHAGNCRRRVGPRGGVKDKVEVWRKNGQVKLWVTRPTEFSVPLKHGLYSFSALFYRESDGGNAHLFHLPEDCPLVKPEPELFSSGDFE